MSLTAVFTRLIFQRIKLIWIMLPVHTVYISECYEPWWCMGPHKVWTAKWDNFVFVLAIRETSQLATHPVWPVLIRCSYSKLYIIMLRNVMFRPRIVIEMRCLFAAHTVKHLGVLRNVMLVPASYGQRNGLLFLRPYSKTPRRLTYSTVYYG